MIRVRLLKRRRREVKVDPKLVANGMFQAWWPMECSKLGGQWNVKEKHIFTFSPFPTFPPTILFKPSFFPFDLKVLLYHGFKPLLMHFFIFLWSINYDFASQCNKSYTPSLSIWFWLKIWLSCSPYDYGVAHGHILQALSHTSEWRIASGVILRFDLNVTSLWWRTRTFRGVHSSWSWTPSSMVLSYFSKLSHPCDFVANWPPILVTNPKPSMKVVTKLKTFLSLHGFRFSTLDTIVGCAVRFINCFLIVRQIA